MLVSSEKKKIEVLLGEVKELKASRAEYEMNLELMHKHNAKVDALNKALTKDRASFETWNKSSVEKLSAEYKDDIKRYIIAFFRTTSYSLYIIYYMYVD